MHIYAALSRRSAVDVGPRHPVRAFASRHVHPHTHTYISETRKAQLWPRSKGWRASVCTCFYPLTLSVSLRHTLYDVAAAAVAALVGARRWGRSRWAIDLVPEIPCSIDRASAARARVPGPSPPALAPSRSLSSEKSRAAAEEDRAPPPPRTPEILGIVRLRPSAGGWLCLSRSFSPPRRRRSLALSPPSTVGVGALLVDERGREREREQRGEGRLPGGQWRGGLRGQTLESNPEGETHTSSLSETPLLIESPSVCVSINHIIYIPCVTLFLIRTHFLNDRFLFFFSIFTYFLPDFSPPRTSRARSAAFGTARACGCWFLRDVCTLNFRNTSDFIRAWFRKWEYCIYISVGLRYARVWDFNARGWLRGCARHRERLLPGTHFVRAERGREVRVCVRRWKRERAQSI